MRMVFDNQLNDYICQGDVIPWSVCDVLPREDFSLVVLFSDGTWRECDCKPLLKRASYKELNSWEVFSRARALHGTVDWGNDIDVAPEYLYDHGIVCERVR